MKVGIADADLIGCKNHRFPNLCCEKISGYYKDNGAETELLTDYEHFDDYDCVYVSKVFTDTPVPDWLHETYRIHIGGTGFYFDEAKVLPYEVEHHMPDYHLYDNWIAKEKERVKTEYAKKNKPFNETNFMKQYKSYTDYSIGYITRGCFRKCPFCVNKKFDKVSRHSPLSEFYDKSRKKICLLDDNFLGCAEWHALLQELIDLNRPFVFKQGLDERLLTDEKCELLFSSRYDGEYIFAFDNIKDYDLIHEKLEMIRRHTDKKKIKFYVLCGFESTDITDIENLFKRIVLLMQYQCLPFVMRYRGKEPPFPWQMSEMSGMYMAITRWCNQVHIFKKCSFRQFCKLDQSSMRTDTMCASMRAMTDFEKKYPDIAARYFDVCFLDFKI